MKRSDGSLVHSTATVAAKLPSDSKKRKGSTIKTGGFSGYGIESDLGDEQDENQPSLENSAAESRLKKGAPRRMSVSETHPAKKQKTPMVADVHQMAFRNYFTKERTTTPLSPMTATQLPLRSIATDDTNRTLTDSPVPSGVDAEAIYDAGTTKTKPPSPSKQPKQTKNSIVKIAKDNDNDKPEQSTASVQDKKGSSTKSTTKGKSSKGAVSLQQNNEPSEIAPASAKSTPKRSKSEDDKLHSNEPKAEKTAPVRTVRDFFPMKQTVRKEESKVAKENSRAAVVRRDSLVAEPDDTPILPNNDSKVHATEGINLTPLRIGSEKVIRATDLTEPTARNERDFTSGVSLSDTAKEPTSTDKDGDDTSMTQESEPEAAPPPPRPRRRLFRVSDISARSNDVADDEPSPQKKTTKVTPSIEISSSESDENSPNPEPEPAEQTAQVQMMRGFFTAKPPTSSSVIPTTDTSSRSDRKVPLPKPKRPVPTSSKARRKRSAFSDSEGSGSEYDSRNSDDEYSDRGPKEDEKPDPNQKAITSMFTKSLARPEPIHPREPEKKKPKMTARSRLLLSGGLSNYSNTCYLNSVLQTFRNIPGCTETLFAIRDKIEAVEATSGSLVKISEYQRLLFENILQVMRNLDQKEEGEGDSSERTAYPKDVIACLRYGKI